ncbi:MAG: 5-(carboxyamino)imidazole ribonucleotide mutase [Chthoniobacterales bacterium]|nr:5-(carboxyamino)imidazole ribonucleotide mutase [Chthoniobacterales bacterium]
MPHSTKKKTDSTPLIGIVMGSKSDWPTMLEAARILDKFEIPYEAQVLSAHRMPLEMADYASQAQERGLIAIIAGAGGAAHLPGMIAAQTILPVLGVPVKSKSLGGIDSLLSIVQMPAGIPVATFAIGEAGAKNAALFAVALLSQSNPLLEKKLKNFRWNQNREAASSKLEPAKTSAKKE